MQKSRINKPCVCHRVCMTSRYPIKPVVCSSQKVASVDRLRTNQLKTATGCEKQTTSTNFKLVYASYQNNNVIVTAAMSPRNNECTERVTMSLRINKILSPRWLPDCSVREPRQVDLVQRSDMIWSGDLVSLNVIAVVRWLQHAILSSELYKLVNRIHTKQN